MAMRRPQAGGRPSGPQQARGRGRRYFPPRRRVCVFCAEKNLRIDYKDYALLKRFVFLDSGKIDTRKKSGTCARHQRVLKQAIQRARILALLPFTPEHMRVMSWRW